MKVLMEHFRIEEEYLHRQLSHIGVFKQKESTEKFVGIYKLFSQQISELTLFLATLPNDEERKVALYDWLRRNAKYDESDFYLLVEKYLHYIHDYKGLEKTFPSSHEIHITEERIGFNYQSVKGSSELYSTLYEKYRMSGYHVQNYAVLPDGNVLYKSEGIRLLMNRSICRDYFILYQLNFPFQVEWLGNVQREIQESVQLRKNILVIGEELFINLIALNQLLRCVPSSLICYSVENLPFIKGREESLQRLFYKTSNQLSDTISFLEMLPLDMVMVDQWSSSSHKNWLELKGKNKSWITSYTSSANEECIKSILPLSDFDLILRAKRVDKQIIIERVI